MDAWGWRCWGDERRGAAAPRAGARFVPQICTRQDEAVGVYEFTFRPEGRHVRVCVDDGVPTVDGRAPAYCRSRSAGELWPVLVEKAYAKLYGGYKEISGGLMAHAISDLMGWDYRFLHIGESQFRPDPGTLGQYLLNNRSRGVQMGCSFIKVPSYPPPLPGPLLPSGMGVWVGWGGRGATSAWQGWV